MSRERAEFGTRRVLAAVALCMSLGAHQSAMAQGQDSFVIGQRRKLMFFGLDSVEGSAEAYWRYQIDETNPSNGPTRRDTESFFRETLSLKTEGFLGDRNLAKLNLDLKLRLTQVSFDSNTDTQQGRTSETVSGYNVNLLILQRSDAPLTVFSRRSQSLLDRQFADTLDHVTTEHGAELSLRSMLLPSRIRYSHREQEQSGRFSGTDFRLNQDTLSWQGNIVPVGGHRAWWDYTYSSVDESGQSRIPNTFDRHDAFLNHTLKFGNTDEQTLRTTLRFFKETGEFPSDRFRWGENLRLRHTKNFETGYAYTFDRQKRPLTTQAMHSGTVSFRHKLYESLTTTGMAGGSQLKLSEEDFESTQQFGNIGFEYKKTVPLGRLIATSDFGVNHQDDSERGGTLLISNELHTFTASGIVMLSRRNIVPASIVITDITGVFVYAEGADYTVSVFGESIEIRRVLGGNITDGQTVQLRYEIGPEPESVTETINLGFTLRYTVEEGPLKGLSPYLRYREQDQDRTSKSLTDLPQNDIQDLIFGIDYDLWRLSLTAEHQIHDSTLSPFEMTRVEGRYTHRFNRRNSILLSLLYQETDRVDDDYQSTMTNASARWNTHLTDKLQSAFVGTLRERDDSDGSDSLGLELELDLTWHYRLTTVYCNVRTAFLESDDSENYYQMLTLGFKRQF